MCFKFENLSRNKLGILKDICVDIIDKKKIFFFRYRKMYRVFQIFSTKSKKCSKLYYPYAIHFHIFNISSKKSAKKKNHILQIHNVFFI